MENSLGLEPKDILDIAFQEQMHKALELKNQKAKNKVKNEMNFFESFSKVVMVYPAMGQRVVGSIKPLYLLTNPILPH